MVHMLKLRSRLCNPSNSLKKILRTTMVKYLKLRSRISMFLYLILLEFPASIRGERKQQRDVFEQSVHG